MAESKRNILKVENLSVSYGHIKAIEQVSLEVNEGELVTLIGANGAGKSTLIAALVGLVRPTNGSIHFLGEDITHRPIDYIVASGISIVPEGRGILPMMTVMENLQLGAYHIRGNLTQRFERVFDRFPVLAERKNQLAGTLSGGEQHMLAVGRALMSDPRLLVLDEPSIGLAPLAVTELFHILENLKREGQTIFLSEQNVRKSLQCADRAYVFEVGKIVLEGSAQEIASNVRVQEAYLGVTIR